MRIHVNGVIDKTFVDSREAFDTDMAQQSEIGVNCGTRPVLGGNSHNPEGIQESKIEGDNQKSERRLGKDPHKKLDPVTNRAERLEDTLWARDYSGDKFIMDMQSTQEVDQPPLLIKMKSGDHGLKKKKSCVGSEDYVEDVADELDDPRWHSIEHGLKRPWVGPGDYIEGTDTEEDDHVADDLDGDPRWHSIDHGLERPWVGPDDYIEYTGPIDIEGCDAAEDDFDADPRWPSIDSEASSGAEYVAQNDDLHQPNIQRDKKKVLRYQLDEVDITPATRTTAKMEDNQSRNPNAPRKSMVVSMVINQHEKGSPHKPHKTKRGDGSARKKSTSFLMATSLLSTIYAIVLVLFGIIFPVSEALQDYWLESYYNGVFLVYLYTVGTVFLLFLQFYTIPKTHKRRKKALEEQFRLERQQRKRTVSSMFSNGDINKIQDGQTPMSNGLETTRHRNYSASTSSLVLMGEEADNVNHTWVNLEGLKEMFSHEGSSFYLRLGALVFGIGNLIYIGLEIDYYLINVPDECPTGNFGWTFVLRLLFTVVQTFLLFKNSKLEVEVHMNITRWGFMHVIATNLCIWIRTLIAEIMHASHHSDDHSGVTTVAYNSTDVPSGAYAEEDICSQERELLDLSSPYLFPFVLEYSLIATGIFAIMTSELRHSDHYAFMHNISHVMKRHNKNQQLDDNNMGKIKNRNKSFESEYDDDEDDMSSLNYAGPLHTHSTEISLKSSHKGMFLGVLLLAVILISMILFLFNENHDDFEQAQLNYLITDICLHFAILVANAMTAYSLNKLSLSLKPMSVDDTILLISMAGSVLFEISILVSTAYYLNHDLTEGRHRTYTILAFCSAFVAAVQTLFQTIVVISGLRRYTSSTQGSNNNSPGREAVTFLIVANVTSWIYRTVQVKELELGIQEEFYGTLAWVFILNLNLPLLLFFRFHSSVCYADIWNVAYKSVDHAQAIISPPVTALNPNASSGFSSSLPLPDSSSGSFDIDVGDPEGNMNPMFTADGEESEQTIHL